MKSPAFYLLEVLFCSGLLLAFYRLLLVRKVSFAACRRYLVAAMLLSAAIPALDIPLYPARTEADPLPLVASQAVPPAEEPFVAEAGQPAAVVRTTAPATDWGRVARIAAAALYLLTAAVSLAILAVRILGIRRLRRRSRITDCGAYAVAENPRVGTPFSFLRTVFLGEGYEGRRREIVVCHEASHVRPATPPNASRSNWCAASSGSIPLSGSPGAGFRRCRSGRPTATCSMRGTASRNTGRLFSVNSSVIIRI